MSLLDRGPDGKFLGWGAAPSAWIPEMVKDQRSMDAAIEALKVACERAASIEYQRASRALTRQWATRDNTARRCASSADAWLRRKEILEDCRKKITEATAQ